MKPPSMSEEQIEDALSAIADDWVQTATDEAWENIANQIGVTVEQLKDNI